MIKELLIKVSIDGAMMQTVMIKNGFDKKQAAISSLEIIGILENLKALEFKKLSSTTNIITRNKEKIGDDL